MWTPRRLRRPPRCVLVNVHGDNYGDELNAVAATRFCHDVVGANVCTALMSPHPWVSMPSLPFGIAPSQLPIGLAEGASATTTSDRNLTRLADVLGRHDAVLSVPSGANLGPYQDASFMLPLHVARQLGVPFGMLFGTVQPSGSIEFDDLVRDLLAQSFVTTRDRGSAEFVRSFGGTVAAPPVDITVIEARRLAARPRRRRRNHAVVTAVVGDAALWHPDAPAIAHAGTELVAALALLTDETGVNVEVVPHSPLSGEREHLRRLIEGSGAPIRLREDVLSAEAYVRALSRSDLVISLRYHGALVGAASGVPVLAIAYEPKTWELLGGRRHRSVEVVTAAEADRVVLRRDALRLLGGATVARSAHALASVLHAEASASAHLAARVLRHAIWH